MRADSPQAAARLAAERLNPGQRTIRIRSGDRWHEVQAGYAFSDALQDIWAGIYETPSAVHDFNERTLATRDRTGEAARLLAERSRNEGRAPECLKPFLLRHEVEFIDQDGKPVKRLRVVGPLSHATPREERLAWRTSFDQRIAEAKAEGTFEECGR